MTRFSRPYAAMIIGVLLTLIGMALVAGYVSEAVVARLGQANQSLLFWYLPILFLGIGGIAVGLGLGLWGVRGIRASSAEKSSTQSRKGAKTGPHSP